MYISWLGLGQGGSNIADEASKRGFYSAAINFSERDLASLEYIERKQKLVGSEGIGKLRADAISLMENNWNIAINFVKENFSHSDIEIIFVPFSTAGGSGSGIAPILLSLLKNEMPNKIFVAMPIIPDSKESYISQRNCLETFEDLSELDICIIPIDNDKAKSTLHKFGKSQLYNNVNEHVVDKIERIVSFTENQSKYGVIDKKDIRSVFSTSGLATIGEVDITQLSYNSDVTEEGIANRIKDSWSKSYFVNVEFEKVVSAAFIFEGQEKLMEFIDLEEVFGFFKNKMPINLYEGYYSGERGSIVTILTGLSWCNSRLKQIDQIIKHTSDTFNSIEETGTYKSNATSLTGVVNKPKPLEKIKDISSLISKFKRK